MSWTTGHTWAAAALGATGVAALCRGCSSAHSPAGDAGDGRPPRRDAQAWVYDLCDRDRVRPRELVLGPAPGSECRADEDCTEGDQGRCSRSGDTGAFGCTYDCCYEPSDCPSWLRCACGVGPQQHNACLLADCTGPEDCGDFACDVSWGCEGPGQIGDGNAQFRCHTALDACQSDADCPARQFCTRENFSSMSTPDDRWRCDTRTCS